MTLQEFFAKNTRAAIAFSGGVDSSYLLYAAVQCGADVHAYFAKTAFQPQFELDDARRLAESVGAKLTVLELDALSSEDVARNPANRCYYCKQNIFGNLKRAAAEDGSRSSSTARTPRTTPEPAPVCAPCARWPSAHRCANAA